MTDHIEKYSLAYVDEYVRSAVQGFLGDPPANDFHSGFLAGLLVVAQEALGHRLDKSPYAEADPQHKFLRPRLDIYLREFNPPVEGDKL